MTMVATVPRCTAEFRFDCGLLVVTATRARTCGDSVGPWRPRAARPNSPRTGPAGHQPRQDPVTYGNEGRLTPEPVPITGRGCCWRVAGERRGRASSYGRWRCSGVVELIKPESCLCPED
jgi:hypothetical protein